MSLPPIALRAEFQTHATRAFPPPVSELLVVDTRRIMDNSIETNPGDGKINAGNSPNQGTG